MEKKEERNEIEEKRGRGKMVREIEVENGMGQKKGVNGEGEMKDVEKREKMEEKRKREEGEERGGERR